MITINYKKIESYAKRIERENLAKNGTSLSWNSILDKVTISCIHHGTDKVDVDKNWKSSLDKYRE